MFKKSLVLSVLAVIGLSAKGFCSGELAQFFDSLFQKQNFVFLSEAVPIYFYDLGNDVVAERSRAGLVSPFYKYGFLTADAGFLTATLDTTPFKEGHPLLGGTVHIDELIGMYFPSANRFLLAATPESSHAFFRMVTLGYGFAHDFDRQKFIHGFYTGLRFKF